MKQQIMPLVSVAVIAYNSSKTVVETLDSIYAQTYKNIELIVSDDCSTDNTVNIVREWVNLHGERFVRTEILTVPKNTGVSANCNRADAACKGEWIKEIAGDDILLPNCVQDCVDYVLEHPETVQLFGRVTTFGGAPEDNERINSFFRYEFFELTQEEKLHRLVFIGNCIPASTSFVNRAKIEGLGINNDERIPLLEDWPKWINMLRAGIDFDFIDKELVLYRITPGALSTGRTITDTYRKNCELAYLYYQFPALYQASDHKLNELHRYVRAKKLVTGKWYWYVINKMLKLLGNK